MSGFSLHFATTMLTMPRILSVLPLVLLVSSLAVDGLVTAPHRLALSTARRPPSTQRSSVLMRKGRPSARKVAGKKSDEKKSGEGAGSAPLNWLEVAASESELPEEGASKAVTLPGGLVVMLTRRKNRVSCLSSSCKTCKYPLLNAKFEEDTESLVCGVCGQKYSITTGAEAGVEKKTGLAGVLGDVMSSNKGGGPISAYQVKKAENGRILAAIGYKYEGSQG